MPIYEYRCSACGFQKDFLQRLNEAPHTKCPECGKRTFTKQVTAAGFQLKGTGWYATDFKNSGAKPKDKGKDGGAEGPAKEATAKESSTKETTTKESSTKESSTKESSKPGSKSGASASRAD